MAHSSIKPIWKYSWKPEGYGEEKIEVDTSAALIGSFIKLPHTFFRGAEFSASLESGAELTIGYENSTLTGKEDLILRSQDVKLSQLGSSNVYRAIEVASKRAKAKKLILKINFIADAFDPADFGQSLNEEADVKHKSLEASEIRTETLVVSRAVLDTISGTWGELTPELVRFASSLIVSNGFQYKDGIVTIDKALELSCAEAGKLRYNPEVYLWEVWNARTKKFVPITFSHESIGDIPANAIPYVSADDKAAQSYNPSFFLDKNTLHIPSLETEAFHASQKKIDMLTSEITWQGHTLRILSDGILDIDNLLQIDKERGIVRIGNVTFDKALLATLRKLEKKDSV